MSIGYMPKKLKKVRSERRRRKKYKHFSCITCNKNETLCKRRVEATPVGVIVAYEVTDCPYWAPSYSAKRRTKDVTTPNEPNEPENKKKTPKGIFKKLGLFK